MFYITGVGNSMFFVLFFYIVLWGFLCTASLIYVFSPHFKLEFKSYSVLSQHKLNLCRLKLKTSNLLGVLVAPAFVHLWGFGSLCFQSTPPVINSDFMKEMEVRHSLWRPRGKDGGSCTVAQRGSSCCSHGSQLICRRLTALIQGPFHRWIKRVAGGLQRCQGQ